MSTEPAFVEVRKVSKRFGATLAVNAVTLSIARGEFFGLLGPSGCGKTTLLRMIGGFTLPDEGAIVLEGEDVTLQPPNRRPTNMVFQSYALFPHLTVEDNVAYGLRRQSLSRSERARRVGDALALVRLGSYGSRRPHELSGGERQRVALARALIMRPKVLLLDEPLGALDKRLREAMQIELRSIQRELGISFVFVTHDQEEALSMSDRVGVMDRGQLLQVAEPRTLYERPVSRAVASFIGTMNFLPAEIVEALADKYEIAAGAGRIAIAREAGRAFAPGEKVLLGVRPEQLEIAAAGTEAQLRGSVEAVSYFGERQQLVVSVPGIATPVIVSIPSGALAPLPKQPVALSVANAVLLPPK